MPRSDAGDGPDALAPDRETVELWLEHLSRFALDHVDDLPRVSALGTIGAEALRIADETRRPIGEGPVEGGIHAVVDMLRRAVPASFNTPGPGYLAYIPGGGLLAAGLADLVADWLNRFTGLSAAAPAFCRLEADVIEWLCNEFGYPPSAYGLLTPGGSTANFTGFVAARHDRLGDDGDYRNAIAYTSDQAHHSVEKSLSMAGIPRANVRLVATDAAFRMDVEALGRAIALDRAAGLRPFLVVAAAGTTNTGAIDPLARIADVCAAESLWLHVDGAYGGAFVLCDEGRALLRGIGRADSIVFDPHKGMFLPYGTGCLLVRDRQTLRRAHAGDADYLQDAEMLGRGGHVPSPCDYGPELSRDFRGLRLWLPLMLHGAGAFRRALSEKLALAERFETGLRAQIERGLDVEIAAPRQLSVVAFRRRRRAGEPIAEWNARNAAWLRAINERGRVYLSSTNLPVSAQSAFTLRVCVLSFRTRPRHLEAGLKDVVDAARDG